MAHWFKEGHSGVHSPWAVSADHDCRRHFSKVLRFKIYLLGWENCTTAKQVQKKPAWRRLEVLLTNFINNIFDFETTFFLSEEVNNKDCSDGCIKVW